MKQNILRLAILSLVSASFCVGATAQDPAWHQVPKDSLTEHGAEVIKIMLTTTDENAMLDLVKQPGEGNALLKLKMFAYKRLGTHGTKAAVPLLVSRLDVPHEGFYARYALETIPGDEIDAALCDCLKDLKDPTAIAGVLTTLGVRAEYAKPLPKSAETAKTYLGNENADIRAAAAYAYALNAGDAAVEFFSQKSINAAVVDSGFLLAEVFLAQDAKDKAINILDALAAADIKPYQKEAAVYRGILARGNDGIEMLVAQLNADAPELFDVGLKASRELPEGVAVTKAMLAQLDKQKTPVRKALLVRAIGDRKDKESAALSRPVITGFVRSDDVGICIAAIQSLKNVGDWSALSPLLGLANETMEVEKDGKKERVPTPTALAARDTLANLSGKAVDDAIVGMLEKGDAAAKAAAIGLIEERRIISAFPLLKSAMKDADPAVRKAALDAFGQVAVLADLPMLLDELKNARSDEDADAMLKVLKSACTRMSQDEAAEQIAKLFATDSIALKVRLIELLMEIGGAKSMLLVESHIWGDDPVLKDKATAVLGQWRSPKDVDLLATACLKLAKESTENRYKVRGLRGYVRLARQFNMSEERRIKICDEVLALADRDEDKKLVFDVYGRNPSLKMLDLAMKYADDATFRENAFEAAVAIGERLQGKSPKVAEAMKQVIEKSGNAALKDKAKIVLNRQ